MRVVPVRLVPVVIAVLCGTLGTAGCGGDGAPAGPDNAGDPSEVAAPAAPTRTAADPGSIHRCDLLTREEAAAAAGNPVQEPKTLAQVCVWEQEDVTQPSHLQVSVAWLPVPPDAAITAEESCDTGQPS